MRTQQPQETAVDRKLIALLAIALVLVSIAICYSGIMFLRSRQPAQPVQQLEPTSFPALPPAAPLTEPVSFDVFMPVVVRPAAPVMMAAPAVTDTSVWRFLSIDSDDIGTFENVTDPTRRLLARCRDPERRPPDRGALYTLYDNGILRAQIEPWTVQRFRVISGG